MDGFGDRLAEAVRRVGTCACVGLDPHLDLLPPELTSPRPGETEMQARVRAVRTHTLGAIEAVADLVPAVKPQSAFFEQLGAPGVAVLQEAVAAAKAAGLVVVLDAKRGDMGSTARAYVHATLAPDGPMAAHAVTLSPYLGPESLEPFLGVIDQGAGCFVLVRTSNPGSEHWQRGGIADQVAAWIREVDAVRVGSSGLGPVGAVIGATLPREARHWRASLPQSWLLLPGYGAQGAKGRDLVDFVRPDGLGALIPASRSVLFRSGGGSEPDWRAAIRGRAEAFVDDLRASLPPLR